MFRIRDDMHGLDEQCPKRSCILRPTGQRRHPVAHTIGIRLGDSHAVSVGHASPKRVIDAYSGAWPRPTAGRPR